MWNRIRLSFARGIEVLFSDRDRALNQIEELSRSGSSFPIVVYGPEGCGKTALFRQTFEILRSYGYSVIYVNPIESIDFLRIRVSEDVRDIARDIIDIAIGEKYSKLFDLVLKAFSRLFGIRRRMALIADEMFQAVGLDKAEIYVKMFLNLIEHPPASYESIVVIVGSSEGITMRRIGRHNWARIMSMWNMSRDGLRQLYDQIPGDKPGFEDMWRWTGGNPRILRDIYEYNWDIDVAIKDVIRGRGIQSLVNTLTQIQRRVLEEAVDDPDMLAEELRRSEGRVKEEVKSLVERLTELNLVMETGYRDQKLWLDIPPPEKDPEIGIGKEYAWQTPIHREAVRRTLQIR